MKAIHNQLPEAEHRMCARHILGNWKRDNHDLELERLFWKIARSYTKGDYADNLEALRRYSQGAYDSLLKTNPPTWSRAFFKVGSCCNDNLNNLSESFNRTIREARKKPLLDLLEDIRRQCMVRTARRSIIANRLLTRFTKRVHTEIESAIEKSGECTRYMSTGDMHEIDLHGCSYRVEMRLRTCGCGKWQLNGIPCNHAACVIIAKKEKVDDYVSEYFTTRTWQQTYERGIEPVEGMKLWPRLNRLPVLPPPNRLGNRGRPNNYARRKSLNESSSKNTKTKLSREHRIITCSNCKEEGHNKLSCSNPSVEPQAKRPRGRPRKELVS